MTNEEAATLLLRTALKLKDDRHLLAAYTAARRAAGLLPKAVYPKGVTGAILWNLERFEEGAALLKECTELEPTNHEWWGHLALCYSGMREDEKATAAYEKAISIKPDDLALKWNRAQFLLAKGDWLPGWEDYEARIEYRGSPAYMKLPVPTWNGEDLTGKTLVVVGEQGVGDTILSSRYLALIRERHPTCKLTWIVQPRLHDLFWEFRHDLVDEFVPSGYPWPALKADYAIYQMSLPKIFGTTLETVPADPGLIRKRMMMQADTVRLPEPHSSSLRIGICWTGNVAMLANDVRSVPLEALLPLAEDPRFTFYSMQVGEGSHHLHIGGAAELIKDCSVDLEKAGFTGTAALMGSLDLVVTVCTSTAHLAGALGVPCLTMLAHDCYWVWGREGDSTPWYPGMRLFRQRVPGEWGPVVEDIRNVLDQFWKERQPLTLDVAAA